MCSFSVTCILTCKDLSILNKVLTTVAPAYSDNNSVMPAGKAVALRAVGAGMPAIRSAGNHFGFLLLVWLYVILVRQILKLLAVSCNGMIRAVAGGATLPPPTLQLDMKRNTGYPL